MGRQDNDGGLEIKDSWRMQVNDEPLDVSIQRKQDERHSEDEVETQPRQWSPTSYPVPFQRMSSLRIPHSPESEQEAPINLEVPKKPWYNMSKGIIPSNNHYAEDQPIDFSKKNQRIIR